LPAKVALSWKPNPETDMARYHIYRQQAGKKAKRIKKVAADRSRYDDGGLDHGTAYVYLLQAEDKDGLLSDFSPGVEAATKPLPQRVVGLKASAIPAGLVLGWTANPEPDIVTYKIYMRSFLSNKEVGSTDKISFTIDTLDSDREYTLLVTAVDQDGLESEKSEPITVRTQ
jgi:fibronectin type 3 domain-containing protein